MRRRTLLSLGAFVGAGSAVLWGLSKGGFLQWLPWIGSDRPTLPAGHAVDVLVALTEPTLGRTVDLKPYRSLFAWRLENLPQERALLSRFAADLERMAGERLGRSFVDCHANERRQILASALEAESNEAAGAMACERIVQLFSRTEAWTLLGYEAPAGHPRGLEDYLQPPPGIDR